MAFDGSARKCFSPNGIEGAIAHEPDNEDAPLSWFCSEDSGINTADGIIDAVVETKRDLKKLLRTLMLSESRTRMWRDATFADNSREIRRMLNAAVKICTLGELHHVNVDPIVGCFDPLIKRCADKDAFIQELALRVAAHRMNCCSTHRFLETLREWVSSYPLGFDDEVDAQLHICVRGYELAAERLTKRDVEFEEWDQKRMDYEREVFVFPEIQGY